MEKLNRKKFKHELAGLDYIVESINRDLMQNQHRHFYYKDVSFSSWLIANQVATYYKNHNFDVNVTSSPNPKQGQDDIYTVHINYAQF